MIQQSEDMILELYNVTQRYGKKIALNSISYKFTVGVYGILGINGAGKSTLMYLLTDSIRRTKGKILYNGLDIIQLGASYRQVLGYMPQRQGFYENFTAWDYLSYLARLKAIPKNTIEERINYVLQTTNLVEQGGYKIRSLSGGMRQRLLFAQAILNDPRVLILDEPTVGLDPNERMQMRAHIAELGKSRIVLVSTHIISDLEGCASQFLIMKKGKLIAEGTQQKILDKCGCSNLEEAFYSLTVSKEDK